MSSSSAGRVGVGRALAHALDLLDPASSASNGEAAVLVPRQKHPRKSPPRKAVPKPFDAPAMKGISAQIFIFHLS
jgi:hypothetical protein